MKPKAILLPVLIAVILAALCFSVFLGRDFATAIISITAKLRGLGIFGWLIFAVAQAVIALIGILPASLLGVAAGAVYGVLNGFIASAIGLIAGALIAFGLSRSAFRPMIAGLVGKSRRLSAFDNLLTKDRWRIVLLLRVSPVMPFSLTSYALGLSGVAMRDYLIGLLGSLPALLGYVIIGALGASTLAARSQGAAFVHITLLVLGAAATLALTIHLSRLLARALRAA
jgi:uncharacterized membrane protein YdjX (TVP38/TMEM64 family)